MLLFIRHYHYNNRNWINKSNKFILQFILEYKTKTYPNLMFRKYEPITHKIIHI